MVFSIAASDAADDPNPVRTGGLAGPEKARAEANDSEKSNLITRS